MHNTCPLPVLPEFGEAQNKMEPETKLHEETKEGLTVELIYGEVRVWFLAGSDEDGWMSISGGDDSNPTWQEYIDALMPEYKLHFELIRQLIENYGWKGQCAQDTSNCHYFKFSDGHKVCFSWRAWGDLMQAIVGEREGYLTYM